MPMPLDHLSLRSVTESDLPIFFTLQQDPTANHMAAFTAKDPTDHALFTAHWRRILATETVIIRTIVLHPQISGGQEQIAGHVLSYEEEGKTEVSYWIDRALWGQGIATQALTLFLAEQTARPLYARVAKDNIGSRRVLEKCGFAVIGEEQGFANARGQEIPELILMLKSPTS